MRPAGRRPTHPPRGRPAGPMASPLLSGCAPGTVTHAPALHGPAREGSPRVATPPAPTVRARCGGRSPDAGAVSVIAAVRFADDGGGRGRPLSTGAARG